MKNKIIKKFEPLPTEKWVVEIKKFIKNYSKAEWSKLCYSRIFMGLIDSGNFKEAKKIAKHLLKNDYQNK